MTPTENTLSHPMPTESEEVEKKKLIKLLKRAVSEMNKMSSEGQVDETGEALVYFGICLDFLHSQRKEAVEQFAKQVKEMADEFPVTFEGSKKETFLLTSPEQVDFLLAQWEESGK